MANGCFVGEKRAYCWNVDSNVGPGQPNKPEDVQLVQFAYACLAVNNKNPVKDAKLRAAASAVVPGAAYSGSPSDPLSVAIREHQRVRGGTQDGVVSSIKNTSGFYSASTSWMLCPLNGHISDALGVQWPHIDKHSKCPAQLKAASLRVLAPAGAS
ncbi:MAG: hypothetical protein IT162_01105 [Bryobacterales bacterium]|nr:hypothetical protein [Bryobacterales bacterium]